MQFYLGRGCVDGKQFPSVEFDDFGYEMKYRRDFVVADDIDHFCCKLLGLGLNPMDMINKHLIVDESLKPIDLFGNS